jgi:hypothetical protein
MNEKLNEIFNIEEQKQPESIGELINIPKQEIQISSNKQEDLNVDYTTVRQNLKELISKGNTAIEGILHVASEGDSPRAYEVVGQLIKTLADANKDLLELHNKVKQIKSENTVTNNNQTQTITQPQQSNQNDQLQLINNLLNYMNTNNNTNNNTNINYTNYNTYNPTIHYTNE